MTPAELIAAYIQIDNWVDLEQKRFDDHLRPHREKMEALKTQLQELMLKEKVNSYKTDNGTAYLSTIVTPSVEDKVSYLDWVIDNWNQWGGMLQIGAPHKATLQEYMDANNGKLPPHVKTSSLIRVNILPRRS